MELLYHLFGMFEFAAVNRTDRFQLTLENFFQVLHCDVIGP